MLDLNDILHILFVLLFLSAIIGLMLYKNFLDYLQKMHPAKWKELGSPTLFLNNSVVNNLAIVSFLKSKQYIDLNDPQLTRISKRMWTYNLIYFAYFLFILPLFLWVIYHSQIPK